jgi:hypothetical protein
METFNLKFSVDNAAFEGDNRAYEIGRILRHLATKLEDGCTPRNNSILDLNGNRIGEWFMDND